MPKSVALAFAALLCVAGISAEAQTPASNPEQAINEIYKQAVAAELAGDGKAFQTHFARDWRGISNGVVYTRDQLLDIFRTTKWERDDISTVNIRIVGPDTAVATAISRSAGTDSERRFEQTDHVMDVFVRRDGKWIPTATG